MRNDILTHFSLYNTYIGERNQRKKKDEEEKYYKTALVYVLCKKSVATYHFSFPKYCT
jgi:hypothetical protein